MKRVAVVLSGCGNQDGAEITEAVSALIALSEAGATVEIFAPETELQEKNFLTGKTTGATRDVLLESARIARGNIKSLVQLKSTNFDGLVFPGGFGVALNLSTWATKGAACTVVPEVERVIKEFYADEKPICAICIAPALIARVLGKKGVTVTLGQNAGEIEKTGAHHEKCAVTDYVTDREHRLITTPAYMYDDATPFAVFTGVRNAIRELVEMA